MPWLVPSESPLVDERLQSNRLFCARSISYGSPAVCWTREMIRKHVNVSNTFQLFVVLSVLIFGMWAPLIYYATCLDMLAMYVVLGCLLLFNLWNTINYCRGDLVHWRLLLIPAMFFLINFALKMYNIFYLQNDNLSALTFFILTNLLFSAIVQGMLWYEIKVDSGFVTLLTTLPF